MSTSHSLKNLDGYVINLDHRIDRWNYTKNLLESHNFMRIKRISAINGKDIDSDHVKRLLTPHAYNGLGKLRFMDEDIGSLGAVGCYLSHYKIWGEVLKSNRPSLVFEDDMVLSEDLESHSCVRDCRELEKYDFVLLGYLNLRDPHLITKGKGVLPYKGRFFGAHFYYITPEGARKLLQGALPINMQVDSYVCEECDLKIGYHSPNLSWQINMGTDIQTNLGGSTKNSYSIWVLIIIMALLFGLMTGILLKKNKIITRLHT